MQPLPTAEIIVVLVKYDNIINLLSRNLNINAEVAYNLN